MTPTTNRRRIIAEPDGTGWLVMLPDGTVERCATKRAVLAMVRRTASNDIDVAVLEWRVATCDECGHAAADHTNLHDVVVNHPPSARPAIWATATCWSESVCRSCPPRTPAKCATHNWSMRVNGLRTCRDCGATDYDAQWGAGMFNDWPRGTTKVYGR